MKKQTPKIIATVMLTIIAILVLYVGTTDGFTNGTPNKQTDDASGLEDTTPSTPPEKDDIIDSPEDNQVDVQEDDLGSDSNQKDPLYINTELPKAPMDSDIYNYQQSIVLDGTVTLNSVHYYTEGAFIVFTHASKSGDIVTDRQTVSVAKLDFDGTVLSIYNIACECGSSYSTSAITTSGLVVVTEDTYQDSTALCNVHILDFDLNGETCTALETAKSCQIYVLSDSFLLFCQRSDCCVYLFKNGIIDKSGTISSGDLVGIFEFGDYFTIVINTLNGYVVTTLDSNLSAITVRTLIGKTAVAIKPTVRDGKQYFLVAEMYDNQLRIAEYTTTFKESDMRYIGVGICDSAYVLFNQSTIFVLLKNGNASNLFLITDDLQANLGGSDLFAGTTSIYASSSYNNGYVLLVRQNETAISLIDIRDDGTSAINRLSTINNSAIMMLDLDHNAIVVYLTESGICINSVAL